MEFTIERAALLRPLAHAQSVVERRNTIPILANVMIRAEDDRLALTASDMDTNIIETLPADVAVPGAITAPAYTLYEIVRKLPDGAAVTFRTAEATDRLKVTAGRSSFSLTALPETEFPELAADDLPHQFEVPADSLRQLLDGTKFAVSHEETRYYLNGVHLHATETEGTQVLRAVATDGHRLARVEIALPDGAAGMPGIIVPRKVVNEVRRLIDETEEPVQISVSDAKIQFTFDDIVLTSKLVDGTFPDYDRVIPRGNDKMMEAPVAELKETVERVATISSDKSRAVKFSLLKDALNVSASSPEQGMASEDLEVQYESKPMDIGYNARYLVDILAQISGETVQFALREPAAPTIIRDPADSGSLFVLMPMRV